MESVQTKHHGLEDGSWLLMGGGGGGGGGGLETVFSFMT